MPNKYFLVTLFFLSFFFSTQAQVKLNYENLALNEILLDLNQRYKVEVSINSNLSENCIISIKQNLASIEQALEILAKQCNLEVKKIAQVYILRKSTSNNSSQNKSIISKKEKIKEYLYQGKVVETASEEPLPFTTLQFSTGYTVADQNGNFSFKSKNINETVEFRHLGYEISDTLLQNGNFIKVSIRPETTILETITITSNISYSSTALTRVGNQAGHIKFNDINNNTIPGNSINLIFNNLRLYPGIMSAGESTEDYVIWGSYTGENHVIYDDITLFNSWGTNDDIGRINPYTIKNVELYKGGYGVPYGNRIGGVVLIDGKQGNLNEWEANLSINNRLANAYLNIPLFNRTSSLQIAGRKSYYQTLDLSQDPDVDGDFIRPRYNYHDINLKFSSNLNPNNQLEFNFIFSQDQYIRSIESLNEFERIEDRREEISEQLGTSLVYHKNWKSGALSKISFARTSYLPEKIFLYSYEASEFTEEELEEIEEVFDIEDIFTSFSEITYQSNRIEELSTKVVHSLATQKGHQLEFGVGITENRASFASKVNEDILGASQRKITFLSAYVQDKVHWKNYLDLNLGLKTEMLTNDSKVYLQPRVNGKIHVSSQLKLNFAWGIYNQFVSRNEEYNVTGNLNKIWRVNDARNTPVLESQHSVLGLSYTKNDFELNIESFFKFSRGQQRLFAGESFLDPLPIVSLETNTGIIRAMGIDMYAKKRLNHQELLLSYSLSKIEENFIGIYEEATQSQRHELKGAWICNYRKFRFSITHIYGSGFPNVIREFNHRATQPYRRTDLAFQYRFATKTVNLETGFSILNLFNQVNLRLHQSLNTLGGSSTETLAMPFTPIVYINCGF